MKDLISIIARALVDNPEQVSVGEIEGTQTIVLELKVAKSDIGKILGKHGNNVRAIRTILSAVSGKERKRVVLEVLE